MKKIRNILITVLVSFMFVFPSVEAKDKVKVYVFEAGGCPYCEKEIQYLEGLESYGEKFEIISKQLYIDNVTWEKGTDYDLGSKVVDIFNDAGFDEADIKGTPLIVISDLYAATNYDNKLESVIDKAYEEGDKDIVSCVEAGNDNCEIRKPTDGTEILATVIAVIVIAGLVALVVTTRKSSEYDAEFAYDEEDVKEEEKVEPKKEIVKKEETKVVVKKKIAVNKNKKGGKVSKKA